MTTEEAPIVSIVIPAWRLTTELVACLTALQNQIKPPPFEIIVVVNGPDHTVAAVAEQHPIKPKVIKLPANIGFGWACNIGATSAQGQHLVFLNDDTIADSNWLSNLYDAASQHPDSIIASLLLNEDGTVAEAGATINSDAVPTQFGAGQTVAAAAEAGLLTERQVDYGSGTAILIPAALFRELGGFDPIYAPAYYEDADLQFRAHEKGHQVWLAPTAVVTHLTNRSTVDRKAWLWFASENGAQAFTEPPGYAPRLALDPAATLRIRRYRNRSPGQVEVVPALRPGSVHQSQVLQF